MKPVMMITARALPLGLVLLGLTFALVAALKQISPQKGLWRLGASLLVGSAFVVGSIAQVLQEKQAWPGAVGLGAGFFLIWMSLRKYKRDPEGNTPAAKML